MCLNVDVVLITAAGVISTQCYDEESVGSGKYVRRVILPEGYKNTRKN